MATINGVEVIGDKSAHDFDLLDKNDGINLSNGIERNREAAEDNHQDIVLHRTDTDVHVTPEWKNSLVTKEILGLYWTAAQTADIINEISIAGGAKLVKVDVLPATGLEQTIYLVPKTDPQAGDVFDEYVWIDGKFEFIGTTKADISNVVKYTDYATSTRGGVIKFSQSHGITMSSDGFLMGSTRTAEQYTSNSGNMLINKGTLENVFTYKGFAANTDVVHLTGTETISGVKTFTSNVAIDGSNSQYQSYATDYIKGVTPSAIIYQGLRFFDDQKVSTVGNHITGAFEIMYNTDGYNKAYIGCRNYSGASQLNYNVGLRVPNDATKSIDFFPSADNKINLGTPNYRWADVNTILINGETAVTPTYLETKAEEWEFTLSDGSTVTKKIVMA